MESPSPPIESPPEPGPPAGPPQVRVRTDPPPTPAVPAVDSELPRIDTERPATVVRHGRNRPRWLTDVALPLLLLGAGAAALVAFGTVEPPVKPDADTSPLARLRALPPVRVAKLRSLDEAGGRLELSVDGQVVPFLESNVAAEVAGRVIEKSPKCEAGQLVTAGEFLMRIDPTNYELEVERLTRQEEQAYESLRELDQTLENTERLIKVALKDIELRRQELKRAETLGRDFASQTELEAAQRNLLTAQQALITQQNAKEASQSRRAGLEAAQKLAGVQLKNAKVNLGRTEVTAPIDGVIVTENADVNSYVQQGTPLVTIETTQKVEVDSKLRVDQLYWVLQQTGAKTGSLKRTTNYELPPTDAIVSYELSGLENRTYHWRAKLVSYDGIGLDPATRTVPVRIVVDDPDRTVDRDGQPLDDPAAPALVRGMFVAVRLLIEPDAELVVVPAGAIQPGNRVYQFVADPDMIDTASIELPDNAPEGGDAAEAADAFDFERWTPGRVERRDDLVPIDSVSFDEAGVGPEEGQRFWVCTYQGDELRPGGWVVVSPFNETGGEAVETRAELDVDEPQLARFARNGIEPGNVRTVRRAARVARFARNGIENRGVPFLAKRATRQPTHEQGAP